MADVGARALGVGSFGLAESPVAVGGGLVFVDLEGRALHQLNLRSGRLTSRSYAQRVCAVVPAYDGGLLVALEQRVEHLDEGGSRTVVSVDVPLGVRLNDGACDARGRFFVGRCGYQREPGRGSLHRLDGDRLTPVLAGLTLPNGLGWSPDGRRLYLVDSVARVVLVHAYDLERGDVGERLATLDTSDLTGYPDGLAVDTEGRLWLAFWGGGAVRCLGPGGVLQHTVSIPVPEPTNCAFTAPGALVVTTAYGDGAAHGAGDLFLAQVPADGLPVASWQRLPAGAGPAT